MLRAKLEGAKAIQAGLFELKTATAKSVARRVLKRQAQPLADAANDAAPRKQGGLAKSYVVTTRLNKRQRVLARRAGRDDVVMYVGTNDPAGVQQEFGNSIHAAQPHFRPAWDGDKDQMLERIRKDLRHEVDRAVQRARRRAQRS